MTVKYRAGDVFAIPLDTGTYALCQVLWAPQGDYRKVIGFCVLERQASAPTLGPSPARPLPVRDGDKDLRLLFTGTQKLKNGEWQLIGHAPLPHDARELLTFHIAGELHEGDTFVRMLSVDEYTRYPSMPVLGFELVHRLLSDSR
ncbi:immunity 26/phosphotriesterase HocA family protein [Xanthomonas sp. PPL568]|uniref:Imm26 family immunity protein n=1 Tax=Xanthomonas indica TaxID=2912242 RepID=UPI001F583141|nr:Imm26 family immunity protein [Xanthomonas indica]MCI2245717.1 immunity 26/phosphotriesterase HocA family protein [Xanthomonas indica]